MGLDVESCLGACLADVLLPKAILWLSASTGADGTAAILLGPVSSMIFALPMIVNRDRVFRYFGAVVREGYLA